MQDKIDALLRMANPKVKQVWESLPRYNPGEWKHDFSLLEMREIQVQQSGDIYIGAWDVKTQ